MANFFIGLDFGTGGAKSCIMADDGRVLSYAYEELTIFCEHAGWSEHDAHSYWPMACRLIRRCIDESRINASEIKGIAVSSALPSMVMVDKAHRPLQRAYNLMDKRAVEVVTQLKETIGEERIFSLSGYRLEDHPLLVNVLWERQHRPESFTQTDKVLTIDGYITLKLTGRAVCHYSAAAFYGVAYDLRNRRFDEQLLQELDLSPLLLPALCRCDEIVGSVTSEAAAETGLRAGISVAGGQVDCNASWLGAGATAVGDFQSNLGSVGNFGIIHQSMDFNFSEVGRLMINFPFTISSADTFVTVPTTLTGGQCLRWIRDQLAPYHPVVENNDQNTIYDQLNDLAAPVPPGCGGLVALPFLMGERTPIWDVNARAMLFGLSLNHGLGHIVRAMMEGVAFALYDSFRLIKDAGLKINYPMVLNEGGAVSRLWRQIIADVFNVPNVLIKNRAGAPFGDALLAAVTAGYIKDYSVAKEWAQYVEPIEPNERTHQLYQEYFSLYKSIYDHVRDDYAVLSLLRKKYPQEMSKN